jgi:hypothetical protein
MEQTNSNPGKNIGGQKGAESMEEFEAIVAKLEKDLREKYNVTESHFPVPLKIILEPVREAFGGIKNVKGKRILDIGSGATSPEHGRGTPWEPWFCRALKELGADAVGVDSRNLDKEEFEHHQSNIQRPGALDFLPGGSFDGVNMSSFFDPENVEGFLEGRPVSSYPESFRTELRDQIKRLLKPYARYLNIVDSGGNDIREELGL